MIFRKTKHSVDPDTGIEFDESTEVWVADFGHDSIMEDELREEVLKLKPRSEASFSWILVSLVLLVFVILTELGIRQIGLQMYWSELTIFWVIWLWRLILVSVWLTIARLRWLLSTEKMFITTIVSFVLAVFVLGVIKIIYVKSAWAWLNLLVEPIWMVLLIGLMGVLIIRCTKNKVYPVK
ncbi:hypothetical protein K8R42_00860 [bacterium]|nr:hypothetical protein [bacterium]